MIEIKNKRMILFPEDRLIGAKGDVNTACRRFILSKFQDGYDISNFVAWIKINPISSGEKAYDQMLKMKQDGEYIILTWDLVGTNLKDAGEVSAQIIMASPDYFYPEDLKGMTGNELIVPARIQGVSAPVWQSYPETFVIEESINAEAVYEEVSKNVLTAAVAQAVDAAETASQAAESALETASQMNDNIENAQNELEKFSSDIKEVYNEMQGLNSQAEGFRNEAEGFKNITESLIEDAEGYRNEATSIKNECKNLKDEAEKAKNEAEEFRNQAEIMCGDAEIYMRNAEGFSMFASECSRGSSTSRTRAEEFANEAKEACDSAVSTANKIRNATDYRLLYRRTLTQEDENCVSFEITQDINGNPIRLSEFVIFLNIPAMPNIGNTYLRLFVQGEGNKNGDKREYSLLSQFPALNATRQTFMRVEALMRGRWMAQGVEGTGWYQNLEINKVISSVCRREEDANTDGKPVTAIKISRHTNVGVPFVPETFIEIWGVDSLSDTEGANEQ